MSYARIVSYVYSEEKNVQTDEGIHEYSMDFTLRLKWYLQLLGHLKVCLLESLGANSDNFLNCLSYTN